MENTPITELDLRSSIYFDKIDNLPCEKGEADEFLLFFELDPGQSHSIEPNSHFLPEKPVFYGKKSENPKSDFFLPAGKYLFTQSRKDEKWQDMAMEQQKDGLWERHKLDNKLYVRFLFEDGCYVTQLFRALKT